MLEKGLLEKVLLEKGLLEKGWVESDSDKAKLTISNQPLMGKVFFVVPSITNPRIRISVTCQPFLVQDFQGRYLASRCLPVKLSDSLSWRTP